MPQLIALALVGAGIYAAGRMLGRAFGQLANELKRAEAAARAGRTGEPKDLGKLVFDPQTGTYMPDGR